MIIFILTLVFIGVISFILAWRSMGGFEEEPKNSKSYSMYWVKNISLFNSQTVHKLYDCVNSVHGVCSFERLFKGNQSALVLFAPSQIVSCVPELELVEIEDYLQPIHMKMSSQPTTTKIHVNTVLGWGVDITNQTNKTTGFIWQNMPLEEGQQLFWQIVALPLKSRKESRNAPPRFQVTLRCLVVDPKPQDRINLAKRIDAYLGQYLGVRKECTRLSTRAIFESFIKRSFFPKQVKPSLVDSLQIVHLLGMQ